MSKLAYKETTWFQYLDHGMKDLVIQSFLLLDIEKGFSKPRFHDYSFIVFPIAKAYEGFLKRFFYDVHLISDPDFLDSHFRIGRSLNPDLPSKFRDRDWIYERLKKLCAQKGDPELADQMWIVWREARNQLFHYYFPDHNHFITLDEASRRVDMVVDVLARSIDDDLKI